MEMPKGWIILSTGSAHTEKYYEKVDEALNFLKEFANALETEFCTKPVDDKTPCKACQIYKKFAKWK